MINMYFIYIFFSENVSDYVDVETVENDVKSLTFRPVIKAKSIEPYRNSKAPRDPETWEDNINKLVTFNNY